MSFVPSHHAGGRRMRALLTAALLLAPVQGQAQSELRQQVEAAQAEEDAREQSAWRQRILEARLAVEKARARVAEAEVAYTQMRTRKYPRGEAKAELLQEREDAKQALAQAQRDLEELEDDARHAGLPASVIGAGED